MDSVFDTIAGLPIHPLVVHAVVMLLPLSAIGLIACVLRPAWRQRFGILVVLGALGGAVAAWVAAQSGEQLAARVGEPADHAKWGDRLVPLAFAFGLITLFWYVAQRRAESGTGAGRVLGIVGALLALGVMGVTVLVGHTGATAAWAGKITSTPSGAGASSTATSSSTPSPSSTSPTSSSTTSAPSSSSSSALTLAVVATHKTQADCWAAINDKVYNLTDWIGQHPGGAEKIIGLCGTDATSAFAAQHGSQREPNERLAQFLVGTLAG